MNNYSEKWAREAAAARGPCPMCANDPQIQKDLERQLTEARGEIERLGKVAWGLATLLDRIETEVEDLNQLEVLIRQRFQIARDAGYEVVFGGHITNRHQ